MTLFVLIRHTGDYIGWYTHDVVAVSHSKEPLEIKVEEMKNRVPGPGELTNWEYEIQGEVEALIETVGND